MTQHTQAPPTLHNDFVHTASLHLHRYLAPWLQAHPHVPSVTVCIGFPETSTPDLTLSISPKGPHTTTLPHTLQHLLQHPTDTPYTSLSTPLTILHLQDPKTSPTPLPDSPLGALLLPSSTPALSKESTHTLLQRTCEAIRATRRNSLRLTLEETFQPQSHSIKDTLYDLLDRLPAWVGVDHSARLLITHNPSDTSPSLQNLPTYDVMAERLYLPSNTPHTRLVGLSQTTSPSQTPLLHDALTAFLKNPQQRTYRFLQSNDTYTSVDTPSSSLPPQPLFTPRPNEGRVILIPLTTPDPHTPNTPSLLGWLRLSYLNTPSLPPSSSQLLQQLSETLAFALKNSSIYTIGTKNIATLRAIRSDLHTSLSSPKPTEDFITRVIQRIVNTTQLPSFSIGLLSPDNPHTLHFPSPHGWTQSDPSLTLDTRLPSSGIVGLALRLNQPIVLAGGSGHEHNKQWNNTLVVHEPSQRILDTRTTPPSTLQADTFTPLHNYYHPAHTNTYATLAFPIQGLNGPLGVVAVEVERTTTWLWWSGLGSQLFYQLLCDELGLCLHILNTLRT